MGIRAEKARSEKASFTVYLMCLYILAMLLLAVYEFLFEKIMLLYYILWLSGLG